MDAFRVGFVTGATPDKWARAWRERQRQPLELVPVTEEEQELRLRDLGLDMCLVRLPVDRDGLHLVPLYDEVPVVVVPRDHFVTAAPEVRLADLVDEQLVVPHPSGWTPDVDQLPWPPMSAQEAVEVVASGGGVAILPMSVARLHHRKDVESRPVTDLPPTKIGLAWLVARDDEQTQAFVGVVRGRTARSSRG
ncbi:LysR family substrate-binding domain-containing protein [Nocardioides euryhalodurans]|uniref:LysR family transcriptional regulator n=1 Tax=Nocardioides euryhalodurans TaxID=2518370 RepID=A0A4P7GHI4_9ACTN|nr:LysR family substrate-binding domain-containing protein [Nocardioides euryhalodurans]QBR91129.1 LysR family transcriptional regulator [Nocardioides euryhalodurans]